MTDRDDRSDVDSDSSDVCVLSDLAETFLVGVRRPLSDDDKPYASRFSNTLRLLGEPDADLVSVGVPILGGGTVMNPYRSTWAPSRSSQSSSPPGVSKRGEKVLPDAGICQAGERRPRTLLRFLLHVGGQDANVGGRHLALRGTPPIRFIHVVGLVAGSRKRLRHGRRRSGNPSRRCGRSERGSGWCCGSGASIVVDSSFCGRGGGIK